MEKIVTFLDYANINHGFEALGVDADYADLSRYLSEGRFLIEAHAYVPVDPRNPHARDREIEALWTSGYLVHAKTGSIAGDSYKCDFDVEMTLDLMRMAEMVKPDIIVLLSGDKDFVPVILELRRRGIRVEAAAFEGVNAAREVMLKASGFIDLLRYLEQGLGNGDDEGAYPETFEDAAASVDENDAPFVFDELDDVSANDF